MISKSTIQEMETIVPGLSAGVIMEEAMILILAELKRLKEIESKYKELCK
jgi:hypothetical protein